MRISDWSSDVCSSDLAALCREIIGLEPILAHQHRIERFSADVGEEPRQEPCDLRVGRPIVGGDGCNGARRSEEHTSEIQSLMRISYAVFCLKKKQTKKKQQNKNRIRYRQHYSDKKDKRIHPI